MLERVLRLIESLLRRSVLALGDDQGVVVLGDRSREAPARDFHLGPGDRFGRVGALDRDPAQNTGREILMHHGPVAINVDAVVGDEPARRQNSVTLGAQVFRPSRERGVKSGTSLLTVLACGEWRHWWRRASPDRSSRPAPARPSV